MQEGKKSVRRGAAQRVSTAARDTGGNVAWKCSASCSGVIPAYTPLHSETRLCYECMASCRRFFFYFSAALVLSRSLFVHSVFSLPDLPGASRSRSLSLCLPPEPLAVINPSIVPVTAEHASYACLFRVEELITTSQQGSYRQQYMWCACDTMSEIHANALCYELYCWISHCAMQHSHYCWQSPYFMWKPPFT